MVNKCEPKFKARAFELKNPKSEQKGRQQGGRKLRNFFGRKDPISKFFKTEISTISNFNTYLILKIFLRSATTKATTATTTTTTTMTTTMTTTTLTETPTTTTTAFSCRTKIVEQLLINLFPNFEQLGFRIFFQIRNLNFC